MINILTKKIYYLYTCLYTIFTTNISNSLVNSNMNNKTIHNNTSIIIYIHCDTLIKKLHTLWYFN